MKVELKSAIMAIGAQCVITTGMTQMLEWLVDNWDFHHLVCSTGIIILLCIYIWNIH